MSSHSDGPVRVFSGRELERTDRILRHVQRGGTAVLDGPWDRVIAVWERLTGRPDELVGRLRGVRTGARDWTRARREALDRVRVKAPDALAAFLSGDGPVAIGDALAVQAGLQSPHPVDALDGAGLVVPPPVFVPRSQPNLWLIRKAVEACRTHLPPCPEVLDMGCGTGVCGFIAAAILGEEARITATDHQPAALAATRANGRRLGFDNVAVTGGGDLFEPVGGKDFDLVIFNAPWVVARARTVAETATHDAGQETLRRFFSGVPDHLKPGGCVVLGYADHSGPRALAQALAMARASGLETVDEFRDRIRTHRQKRAWETIVSYVFRREEAGRDV